MINTVRIWTRKPSLAKTAANEKCEGKPKAGKEATPGFFESFFKMWENQANMVIRGMDD
ncbi:MAG: hypothetical protein IT203_10520 [Fimbriimonadaceae bacterium]|nr:hypothetical protein [Fimbriimonadaceae bacterium]